jgi:D-glycero-alpha-D-manno-heptose-7-phosphate kinase
MSKAIPTEIVAKAPCRADLAGSTLDLWPLYLFHPGAATVNFAVSVYATCRIVPLPGQRLELRSLDTGRAESFSGMDELLRAKSLRHPVASLLLRFFRPQQGMLIETHSESPAGAGISGSSALMIATAGALARVTGRKMTLEALRVLAQNVEAQVIRVPTGCQDYYPALYGGVSAIELAEDGIHRHPIDVPPEELESRVVLAYTGAPRQSGINNWEVFKAHIDGDRKVFRNFEGIAAIARRMEAPAKQCAGNFDSADRSPDRGGEPQRGAGGEGLRRRRGRMRGVPGRAGGARAGGPGVGGAGRPHPTFGGCAKRPELEPQGFAHNRRGGGKKGGSG